MRRFSKLVTLAAMLSAMFVMIPSAPAADIAGGVAGNVLLGSGGVPLTGCNTSTTYTFEDVAIRGTLRANNGTTFIGTIDVSNVSGGTTGCESTASGTGVVNSVGNPATFASVGSGNVNSATGSFYGTYTRTESIVLVTLNLSFNISGNQGTATVNVRAQFTPTEITGGAITKASFIGPFSTV